MISKLLTVAVGLSLVSEASAQDRWFGSPELGVASSPVVFSADGRYEAGLEYYCSDGFRFQIDALRGTPGVRIETLSASFDRGKSSDGRWMHYSPYRLRTRRLSGPPVQYLIQNWGEDERTVRRMRPISFRRGVQDRSQVVILALLPGQPSAHQFRFSLAGSRDAISAASRKCRSEQQLRETRREWPLFDLVTPGWHIQSNCSVRPWRATGCADRGGGVW